MEANDVLEIAEGLRLIEQGITRIQNVMRNHNSKSLKDVAAELIPVLGEDDSLRDTVLKKLQS